MGFNATRLSIARKRRQLTKKALSERAKVSQLTLTRLESGETSDPGQETVESLASALKFPVEFFYLGECSELTPQAASFRSLSTMTSRQRDAALAAGSIAFDLDRWITKRFTLPSPNLPDLREEIPSAAAAAVRSHWGIGSKPIPHVTKLLEAMGVRVFTLSEGNKSVDAFSCWIEDTPYIFLNTFKSAERSRFDAAHELGHLVLHRHGTTGHGDVEREADQFAAAFLVPRGDLIASMPRVLSLAQLIEAKERLCVSVAALARNAFEAGLVSEWHYREMCRQISARGYRAAEPNARRREESVLWKKVFESLWKDGQSKEYVARELCLPLDEIEALIGGLYGEAARPVSTPTRKPLLSVV